MRSDLRALQVIVKDYLHEHDMTQDDFAEKGGEPLTRAKVGYLVNGHAANMDTMVLAAFARAMEMPFNTLAGRIGIMGAVENAREAQLLAEAQAIAAQLDGVQKDIFLDKLEALVESSKRSVK